MPSAVLLAGVALKKGGLKTKAAEAIKPGMLLQITSGEYAVHATSGGNARRLWAPTSPDTGLETAFADGKTIEPLETGGGAKINAILADSQTIIDGDPLESNGDGTLIKHTAADETTAILHARIVGYANEAVTTSGAVARLQIIA